MPQIDKVTFFPIVFWLYIIFVGGYLLLNATILYAFLTELKLMVRRNTTTCNQARFAYWSTVRLLQFPLISLA